MFAVVVDDVPYGFQAAAFQDADRRRAVVSPARTRKATLLGKSAIAGVLTSRTAANT